MTFANHLTSLAPHRSALALVLAVAACGEVPVFTAVPAAAPGVKHRSAW